MDLNIIVGGAQGSGIETAGLLAIRALAVSGLEVFADREYHSNIKGKHSYSHIRASEKAVHSIKYPVDALGGLDVETIATHYQEVKKGGVWSTRRRWRQSPSPRSLPWTLAGWEGSGQSWMPAA